MSRAFRAVRAMLRRKDTARHATPPAWADLMRRVTLAHLHDANEARRAVGQAMRAGLDPHELAAIGQGTATRPGPLTLYFGAWPSGPYTLVQAGQVIRWPGEASAMN